MSRYFMRFLCPSESVGNGDKNLDGSLPRSPVHAHVILEVNNNSRNRFNNATIVDQAASGSPTIVIVRLQTLINLLMPQKS